MRRRPIGQILVEKGEISPAELQAALDEQERTGLKLGQILIETVFSYPGLGFLLVSAVGARDYPLMQGLFLMITLAVLLANFIVDVIYTRLDPRVRAG